MSYYLVAFKVERYLKVRQDSVSNCYLKSQFSRSLAEISNPGHGNRITTTLRHCLVCRLDPIDCGINSPTSLRMHVARSRAFLAATLSPQICRLASQGLHHQPRKNCRSFHSPAPRRARPARPGESIANDGSAHAQNSTSNPDAKRPGRVDDEPHDLDDARDKAPEEHRTREIRSTDHILGIPSRAG